MQAIVPLGISVAQDCLIRKECVSKENICVVQNGPLSGQFILGLLVVDWAFAETSGKAVLLKTASGVASALSILADVIQAPLERQRAKKSPEVPVYPC